MNQKKRTRLHFFVALCYVLVKLGFLPDLASVFIACDEIAREDRLQGIALYHKKC